VVTHLVASFNSGARGRSVSEGVTRHYGTTGSEDMVEYTYGQSTVRAREQSLPLPPLLTPYHAHNPDSLGDLCQNLLKQTRVFLFRAP
jgi:hypothetical protein